VCRLSTNAERVGDGPKLLRESVAIRRGHLADILRLLALLISLSLLGCGSSEEPTAATVKTAAPGDQPQNEQHRPACLPQDGGGIICQ
jgi:hypothetical protein